MNNRKELSAVRQVSASTSTGRKTLAASTSRNPLGFRSRLASRFERVQRQLGKKIRTLRKKKGLSCEQLAKGCGVTVLKISRIENGQINLALSTIIHLSKRLGARLDRLFEGIK